MKRLIIFILTLLITLVQAETWTVTFAAANIPLACSVNQYSVDRITGKDQFTNLGCFNENQFQQAYDFMIAQATITPNVVIRHDESYSPMNIVAADRAMAYSQNHTYLKIDTMNIHRDKALSVIYSYLNQSNPLYYYKTEIKTKVSTESVKPSDLSVEIEVNGARGYVELNGVDIIPLIYVENRANDWFISFTTRNSLENTYTGNRIRPNITQYIVYDVTNTTKTGSVTLKQIKVQVDTALYSNSYDYGLAPSWLPNGTYYSPNGITFYTDMNLKNPVMNGDQVGRYYNYYDYINLRTKSNYSGSELDEYFMYFSCRLSRPESTYPSVKCNDSTKYAEYFTSTAPIYSNVDIRTSALYPRNTDNSVREIGSLFVNAQNTYGMNALMIYAMALHESGYGTSGYARTRNNLFGWGAYDSNPDNALTFPNIAQGINEHMGINLRYYLDATNTSTPLNKFYASNIGNKGAGINTRYASDPWWSVKIAGIAFRIDRYLGLKDFDNYQLSILNNDTRTFYKDRNLQNTAYSIDGRASNYPVVISSSYNNTYYTQSTNPIVNGNIVTNTTPGLVVYDWNNSKVYLSKIQLTLVNTSKVPVSIISDTDVLLANIESFNWVSPNIIKIKGKGILDNTSMIALASTTHTIEVYSLKNNETKYSYPMNTIEAEFNNYNGLTYKTVNFEGQIDLTSVPDGSYGFRLVTKYGDTVGTTILRDPTLTPKVPETVIVDNKLYKTILDSWNTMEHQVIITSNIPAVTISSKLPSEYMSVARFYDFSVTDSNVLSLKGLGYINNANMGDTDSKLFKLIFINKDDVTMPPFVYDLEATTGDFDPSLSPYNYKLSWFNNQNVDISLIPTGAYKILLYIKSNSIEDLIEIRDFSFKGDITVRNSTKIFTLKMNAERRNYDLIITNK